MAALPAAALGACGYGSEATKGSVSGPAPRPGAKELSAREVRIGYFGTVVQATALVGIGEGHFAAELGGTRIRAQVFNAGPAEIEALNAGSVDIGWIGPSPAVNGYARSGGRNLRIISGSASGGVSLVVDPAKIGTAADVKGRRIATPQLGNTQDVALLHWITAQGWSVDGRSGRGDVTVIRQDNKEIPGSFLRGSVDGAWVPEPTAARLVADGGKVLLHERDQWRGGRFAVTNVIASQRFLTEHPDVVEAVLRGSVRTNAWIRGHPDRAGAAVNAQLERLTGRKLPAPVLRHAFADVAVLYDPLAATLRIQTERAVRAGMTEAPDLNGIYDLRPLNRVLRDRGLDPVDDTGLGIE
ncbi:ABC transporter substrate-binding protein [Streptomyces sp. NPDC002809]|uniref:ABC transporter substrate-binding protein n=1 Tax=Streptomyces sp. NPDC002809 TaxID=3154433 RepID=UPI003332F4F8